MRTIVLQSREQKPSLKKKHKKVAVNFSRGSKHRIKHYENGKSITAPSISNMKTIPINIYNTKHNYNEQF